MILPSPPDTKYAKFCLNITNAMVLIHPQLPSNPVFDEGICQGEITLANDLTQTRSEIKQNSLNSTKIKIMAKVEATVQSSPVEEAETVLEIPQITFDGEVFVGKLTDLATAQDNPSDSPKVSFSFSFLFFFNFYF